MPSRLVTFGQGRWRVDLDTGLVLGSNGTVCLGAPAVVQLRALLHHRGQTVEHRALLRAAWPERDMAPNNLHVHARGLRRVFGQHALVTTHGRGYRWTLEPDTIPSHGLIGRDTLLAALSTLLESPTTRLVTLHGPGGVGKMRLAQAIVANRSPQSCCLLALEGLAESSEIAGLLARTLGLQANDESALDTLIANRLSGFAGASAESLAASPPPRFLLALDNLEHLMHGARPPPLVQRLLDAVPTLVALVTSRQRLRLPMEVAIEVRPLDAGDINGPLNDALLAPAPTLFLQRARELLGHDLREAEPDALPGVISICHRLDGLPLALELAAARLPLLGVHELIGQIELFPRIVGAGDDAPPSRHRSLHDTLRWGLDLLAPARRQLFTDLSIFQGGFDLVAACAVEQAAGGAETIGLALHELTEVHFLRCHPDAEPARRGSMFETIHQFGQETLLSSGRRLDLAARHAAWYCALAAQCDDALRSPARASDLATLRADRANLRAALVHVLRERRDAMGAMQLASRLSGWWYFDGSLIEGRDCLQEALALDVAEQMPEALRARVLTGACRLNFYLGQSESAIAAGEQAVALARMSGDQEALAWALHQLAIPMRRHSGARCLALHDEACDIFRALGNPWGEALATVYGGIPLTFDPTQQEAARRRLERGRALFEALGDSWGSAAADQYLSVLALRRAQWPLAQRHSETMLASSRELGDGFRIAAALHQGARIALAQGNDRHAFEMLLEAIEVNDTQGRHGYANRLLPLAAHLLHRQGRLKLAATLLGAASIDRGPMQVPLFLPEELSLAKRTRVEVAARLGQATFKRALQEGQQLSLPVAIGRMKDALADWKR